MKAWILVFAAGLAIGAIGTSMAAPSAARAVGVGIGSQQAGVFVWSPSTRRYLTLDSVVQSLQGGHNDLVRRVGEMERASGPLQAGHNDLVRRVGEMERAGGPQRPR